jgi:hypothetical protein
MRYVVNSSDLNDVYSFFMPIMSILWKRLQYEPISLLYGDESVWSSPKDKFILDSIRKYSKVSFVAPAPGYKSSTVMQVSRLFPASLSYMTDSDYVLTGDADMFPLSATYFNQQDLSCKFNIFSADAYADIAKGLQPPKFPMCYLGATVGNWKDVMGIKTNDISLEVQQSLVGRADTWYNDEEYFTSKIMNHKIYEGHIIKKGNSYYKGDCQLMVRGGFADPGSRAYKRLDREAWYFRGETDLIDSHSLRPGYKWIKAITDLLKVYYPADMPAINSYINEFMRFKNG